VVDEEQIEDMQELDSLDVDVSEVSEDLEETETLEPVIDEVASDSDLLEQGSLEALPENEDAPESEDEEN